MSDTAKRAVEHLLRQIQRNPRLAYFIAPYSQSLELLTDAHAEAIGRDPQDLRLEFYPTLKIERPGCRKCNCDNCKEES